VDGLAGAKADPIGEARRAGTRLGEVQIGEAQAHCAEPGRYADRRRHAARR